MEHSDSELKSVKKYLKELDKKITQISEQYEILSKNSEIEKAILNKLEKNNLTELRYLRKMQKKDANGFIVVQNTLDLKRIKMKINQQLKKIENIDNECTKFEKQYDELIDEKHKLEKKYELCNEQEDYVENNSLEKSFDNQQISDLLIDQEYGYNYDHYAY